jgi:selenocysteine lyase/cysteine desulfurase
VVISGFEHNAVTRTLHALGAKTIVAGRRLFDWGDTLEQFENALRTGPQAAVFTHVSNVFGYILPVEQMAAMCRKKGIPFVIDAAQSAGSIPLSLKKLGADFIAMPGHKGLLGPQGTGLLLCGRKPQPLLYGGTGSESLRQDMPEDPPERAEAGTLNVPGIAGLAAGLRYLKQAGVENIGRRERLQAERCAAGLKKLGMQVYAGPHQSGTVSFRPGMDCETAAGMLARQGIAVRAGLHCAPLAHESAGTLETGTLRVSFGHDAADAQTQALLKAASKLLPL